MGVRPVNLLLDRTSKAFRLDYRAGYLAQRCRKVDNLDNIRKRR